MLDSVDLIIKKINFLDIYYLRKLGIEIKKYTDNRKCAYDYGDSEIKTFEFETEINTEKCYDHGYTFEYKNIRFKYSKRFKYLLLMTHANEIIHKDTVALSDKEEYKQIVMNIVAEIIPLNKFHFELHRIDYKVDILFPCEEIVQEYIKLLNKHNSKYLYMRKHLKENGTDYNTSLYLTNKTGQITFNFYNKYQEQINKMGFCDEKYKYVLRLEVQNRPAKLKAQLKNNKKEKILDNYYTKEGMEKHFFRLIAPYLYKGDYYKMKQAKQIINKSKLSKKWKEKLKAFLEAVAKYGSVRRVYIHRYCCEDTGKKYIKKLNKLRVNPITLDDDCPYDTLENLVKLAGKTAKEKYFK